MRNEQTNNVTMAAMFIALVMAATYIGVPTPGSMGGYWHLGTLVMLAISMKYGKNYGALAGGIGMALFDLFSPWVIWAPGTFVIRVVMGYVVGLIAFDKELGQGGNWKRNAIAFVAAILIMMPGYFVYQAWILGADQGGYAGAVAGIPGNAMQFVAGLVSFYLIRKLPDRKSLSI